MISVTEACQLIDAHTKHFGAEKVPFLSSLRRTLAVDVKADRDFPPFDRVTMDGIAISYHAFANGQRQFPVEAISPAGSSVITLQDAACCIEVMTGTMLPINTDAVIPYEQCDITDRTATVNTGSINPFRNIHRQGTDETKGSVLLQKDTIISPAHISIMATVGLHEIEVYKLPSVAICSTGDELVTVKQTPLPHQIRQSNIYFLAADLQTENITASLHHLWDDKEDMRKGLQEILQHHDVVLLSGAVSKGRYDFLPEILEDLGMKTIFHKVQQRPGKPFLFGVIGEKLIFGFPGNPVSTFVCYHLYFRRWLSQSLHQSKITITAKLGADIALSSPLTNHVPVRIKYDKGECLAEPVSFSTSGDIPSLLHADGIISLPPQKEGFVKGEIVEVIFCR